MTTRFLLPALTTVLSALPLAAQTEQITNGDFETGDFTGWTVVDTGNGFIQINDGTLAPPGGIGTNPPIGGSFDAVTNGAGAGSHTISQQFVVPPGLSSANISWDDRINNLAGTVGQGFSDPNQEFRVLLKDTSGALIQEIFSTNPGDPLIQPTTNRSFDLTTILLPLAGQTVEISFEEQDNLYFFHLFLDNISLTTTSAAGFAAWNTYGNGCGQGTGSSFYEQFDAAGSALDLVGSGFAFFLGSDDYALTPALNAIVPPTTPGLGIGDDTIVGVQLPWLFAFPGGTTNSIDIDSNGSIYFEPGAASDFTPTIGEFLGNPARVSPLYADLSPNLGGSVHAEQDPGNPLLFHITWSQVPNFAQNEIADMQVTLDAGSMGVEFKYSAQHTANGTPAMGIVGWTPGGGVPDPGAIDISAEVLNAFVTGNDAPALALDAVNNDRPVIGQVFDLEVTNLPPGNLGGVLLLFLAPQNPGIDLAIINAPGCQFLVADPFLGQIPLPGGTDTVPIPIDLTAAGPALAGISVFAQGAFVGVPNVPSTLGMTNAGEILIDLL